MFDIGFWELAIIAVVGLLILGPERLPRVARSVGYWVGRAQRIVHVVKQDIEREIAADEIKKSLKEHSILDPDTRDAFLEIQKSMHETQAETEQALSDVKPYDDVEDYYDDSLDHTDMGDYEPTTDPALAPDIDSSLDQDLQAPESPREETKP